MPTTSSRLTGEPRSWGGAGDIVRVGDQSGTDTIVDVRVTNADTRPLAPGEVDGSGPAPAGEGEEGQMPSAPPRAAPAFHAVRRNDGRSARPRSALLPEVPRRQARGTLATPQLGDVWAPERSHVDCSRSDHPPLPVGVAHPDVQNEPAPASMGGWRRARAHGIIAIPRRVLVPARRLPITLVAAPARARICTPRACSASARVQRALAATRLAP